MVLPDLEGPPLDRRRPAADQALANNAAHVPPHARPLRAPRSKPPPAPAAGPVARGLRQPKALNRSALEMASPSSSGLSSSGAGRHRPSEVNRLAHLDDAGRPHRPFGL